MELVNPAKKQWFNYPAFRTGIRDALDASVRTSTKIASFGKLLEVLSVSVAFANFLFVTLLTSSSVQAGSLSDNALVIGSLISLLGIVELGMRGSILWTTTYHNLTKLDVIFHSFAAIGALISCYGIGAYLGGYQGALGYFHMGRAIDMVRTMRFFPMFRDVVTRSIDVLPALGGPVFLVLTTIHVFVTIGRGLWGGQINVEDLTNDNQSLQPLYCLNNFNSYTEGLVTIFNVLVINDWHEIAKVFLNANQYSHPVIVYTYFVIVVLIAVCIMLNVITAFLVEGKKYEFTIMLDNARVSIQSCTAFTARLTKDDMDGDGIIRFQKAQTVFNVSNRSEILNQESMQCSLMGKRDGSGVRHELFTQSDHMDVIKFDVFERQGFDSIIRAVAQSTSEKEKVAKCLCETLEAFKSMFFEMYVLPTCFESRLHSGSRYLTFFCI